MRACENFPMSGDDEIVHYVSTTDKAGTQESKGVIILLFVIMR